MLKIDRILLYEIKMYHKDSQGGHAMRINESGSVAYNATSVTPKNHKPGGYLFTQDSAMIGQ